MATNAEKIIMLEQKINDLEMRFNTYSEKTDNEIVCMKQELKFLREELLAIKTNTNQILDVNTNQTNMLTTLLEKSFDSNIQNNNFLQKLSGKQLVIIGTVITVLLAIVKILFGIPF